jgi:excisionase family DNA binding protein
MEPLALTIPEAAKLGGPKRDKAYKEIRAGRLRAVKRGRNTLILVEDLKRYLSALPAIEPQDQSEPAQHGLRRGQRRRVAK